MSTSPGAPRSSQGTRRTGRSRSPSGGMPLHSSRPRTSGWPRAPSYEAATTPPCVRQSSRTRSTAAGASVGAVGEDDDDGRHVGAERREAAAERRARAVRPLGAPDQSCPGGLVELVRSLHDHDLVDRRLAEPLEDAGEQDALLRAAEARRLAGGEDDRGDRAHQLSSTVTVWRTTGCDGGPSPTPRASMRITASMPSVTLPTIA